MAKQEREIPWCTIFLAVGAIVAHSMVLCGNLATSKAMASLGDSTAGWSSIGLSLSSSLTGELDVIMTNVTTVLTDSIALIQDVQSKLDYALGMIGSTVDDTSDNMSVAMLAFTADRENERKGVSSRGANLDKRIMNKTVATLLQQPVKTSLLETKPGRSASWSKKRNQYNKIRRVESTEVRQLSTALQASIHEKALAKQTNETTSADELKQAAQDALKEMVESLMQGGNEALDKLLKAIEPALLQIQKWMTSFGDKITSTIEGFSTSLDKVQKILDQLMGQLSSTSGTGKEDMLYDTYTLFDMSSTGYITVQDLQDVAVAYGITSIQGTKAVELFRKYDYNNDGKIYEAEFADMVEDPSVPSIMAVVLRTFAEKLSIISGNVAAAKMRDEVAAAVVEYFTLICAKNLTKVQWVSDTLTNASLPMEFTADTLKNLVESKDDPNKLINDDVGQIIVTEMMVLNATYVLETAQLMGQPDFWDDEGFDPAEQPKVVEQVMKWILATPEGAAMAPGMEKLVDANADGKLSLQELIAALPAAIAAVVKKKSDAFVAEQKAEMGDTLESLYQSDTAQELKYQLLGGVAASESSTDPEQMMAVNSGQPAVPETLLFALYLSRNASDTSARFQQQCFDYSSESSNTMSSFANQVQGMFKKVQNFIQLMEEYSTPTGIQRLEDEVHNFAERAAEDILAVLTQAMDEAIDAAADQVSSVKESLTLSQTNDSAVSTQLKRVKKAKRTHRAVELSGVWPTIQLILVSVQLALPTVVDDLKFARKEVSAISSTLENTFSTFSDKGPPIFDQVATVYKSMWTAYFTIFFLLTASVLFYGLWASGFCGGPQPTQSSPAPEDPRTFRERLRVCCASCSSCISGCQDNHLCFWSVILIFQILVLVLFLVSIVLCILAGVKAFLSAGCAQVYILGDPSICTGLLATIRSWLLSFMTDGDILLEDACEQKTLVTCSVIGKEMKTSALLTTVGSLIAAVLSFQMVIESAILHERARWRKLFDDESKTA